MLRPTPPRHPMKSPRLFALLLLGSASLASAGAPLYENDFQKSEPGKLPEEFMVMSGAFAVQAEGPNKFLELPGEPLDTFGLLFGPAQPPGGNATGKFFGTKQGRKFPAFGLSLGGVGGFRLQMSGGKKALEIVKGEETLATAPFTWESGAWLSLRLQVRHAGAAWVVEGKAWPAASPEPAEWNIHLDSPEPPPAGRAAVWGSPYSGTPIRFDDLRLDAAP